MIFSAADRDALFRSQVRKACETTAITGHHEIPLDRISMIQKQLLREINRCSHMLRIADNDFTKIRRAAVELDAEPISLPAQVYADYLGILDEQTRENEAYYMFLYSYMLGYMGHIRGGIAVADQIEGGGNPISDLEKIRLSRVRRIYERCADHCRDLLDEDTVPYDQALEYIECALEEISIMLRVGTGKDVELDEISNHMEWAESADSTPFRNLFMVDMDPDDLSLVEDFEVDWERRLDIMIG